ncbi:SPOR domain-containing protein [Novosphingobium sp.]|uniref:SPOR domain-containing protein n=1 Tax=Novosphingobium sp. TaxID=1874826 RepID=UPI00333F9CA8
MTGMMARVAAGLCIGALMAVTAVPAMAQVKEGVDAWTRGDYDAAVGQWQGPAAKGDSDAMFNMGQAYKLGRGVPKDLAKAEDFYARAAKKGHIRAADNYGILLFQTNRQSDAMPWLNAAADRGEPRAMYILGIASYNGDYAPKDPVRAYALMTRAANAGLQQAINSLAAMNEALPLEQRQQGVALAGELERKTTATRAQQMSAADLGAAPPVATVAPVRTASAAPAPRAIERVELPPARTTQPDVPAATTLTAPVADTRAPITAGADYAQPVTLPAQGAAARTPTRAPAPAATTKVAGPAPKPAPAPRAAQPAPASDNGGGWRVQLGAFGQKSNADALWAKLRNRPEIAGHARIDAGTGVARLMAGGYSEAGAKAACAGLKSAGLTCLVVNR